MFIIFYTVQHFLNSLCEPVISNDTLPEIDDF